MPGGRPGSSLAPKPAPPKDWEDEFHRLQDKHNELKGMYNESVEHNRKLQAQIRKLHTEAVQLTGGGGGGPVVPQSREDEQLVAKLYQENSKLKASNTALKEKNKLLVEALEKKKRELALANKKNSTLKSASVGELPAAKGASGMAQEIDIKPAPTSRKLGGGSIGAAGPKSGPVAESVSLPSSNADNSKLLQVARDYKVRCVEFRVVRRAF